MSCFIIYKTNLTIKPSITTTTTTIILSKTLKSCFIPYYNFTIQETHSYTSYFLSVYIQNKSVYVSEKLFSQFCMFRTVKIQDTNEDNINCIFNSNFFILIDRQTQAPLQILTLVTLCEHKTRNVCGIGIC